MAKIIDEGVLVHEIDVVIEWGIWLLIITLIAFVAGITNSFFAAFVSQNFGFDIRNNMYSKIQNLSFHRLVLYPTANLITRLTNDVTQIQHTTFIIMRIALRAPLLVLLGTIMAFLVNWKIALVFIFTIPVIIFFLFYMMKLGIKNFRSVQKRLDQVNRIIRENLKAMRIIKAFYRKESEVTRFIAANHQLKDTDDENNANDRLNTPILLFIMKRKYCSYFMVWKCAVTNRWSWCGRSCCHSLTMRRELLDPLYVFHGLSWHLRERKHQMTE